MKIRLVQKEDIAGLLELEKQFQKDRGNFLPKNFKVFDVQRPKSDFNDKIKDKNSQILIAEDDQKIIGFMINKIEQFKSEKQKFLQGKMADIYIRKEYRGKGIASKFYNQSLKWFKKRGCKYIQLSVYDNNPAKKIYVDWGFKPFTIVMKKRIK